MKVLNIHTRILDQPKSKVSDLIKTLSTQNDKIWPKENWPRMKFKEGIGVGAKGGHGPIRYRVEKYDPNENIQFRFSKPKGFNGIHKFEIKEMKDGKTEVKHTIDMDTTGKGTVLWLLGIRALHDALIEDGFDKMENYFDGGERVSGWSIWVRLVRRLLG